jgi:hypothetical protein
VGDEVTIKGKVSIDATSAGTLVQLGMSIPVASGFGGDGDAGGTLSSNTSVAGRIISDNANSRLEIQLTPTSTSNTTYTFIVSYHITPP